jgi:hypothetical protein
MTDSGTFGEFLVSKGVITNDDLLSALMEQIKVMPSIAEIVYNQKLVSVQELAQVLSLQSKTQVDFISACKQAGKWNERIQEQVWSELENVRVPLVQVLVRHKKLSHESVNKYLDSYLAETQSSSAKVNNSIQSEKTAQPVLAVSPVDLPVSIVEFLNQFSNEINEEILSYAKNVNDLEKQKAARDIFHRLAGAARFAKLSRFQHSFEALENVTGELLEKNQPEQMAILGTLVKDCLEPLWSLRSFVGRTGTEANFSELEPQTAQRLDQSIEDILNLQSK